MEMTQEEKAFAVDYFIEKAMYQGKPWAMKAMKNRVKFVKENKQGLLVTKFAYQYIGKEWEAVECAFNWNETPEGVDYWREVRNEIKRQSET